jgi:hypothetical protein
MALGGPERISHTRGLGRRKRPGRSIAGAAKGQARWTVSPEELTQRMLALNRILTQSDANPVRTVGLRLISAPGTRYSRNGGHP